MGLRLTSSEGKVAMFDSVTDWAFGPAFNNEHAAELFMEWARLRGIDDLRALTNPQLYELWEQYGMATENRHG